MLAYTWIPFFVIALDQMSKRVALYWNDNNIFLEYSFLKNHVVWNKGISFGLFASSYYNIIIYCCIVLSICLIILAWLRTKNKFDAIAWGLIVGGGLSNLWDRWFFGAVLDFICVSFNTWTFPIFNFADISITIGAIILARVLVFKPKKKKVSSNENNKIK